MIDSIFRAGLEGIQQGLSNAGRDADKISRAFSPGQEDADSLVTASVNLRLDLHQVQASRKIVQVAQRLSSEVLDILA